MPACRLHSLPKMGQVESSGGDGMGSDDAAASMIQRFWDSAMALGPLDDETDTQSQMRLSISGALNFSTVCWPFLII